MPLIDLWKAKHTAVEQMTIQQIVSTAGDGKLKDNSLCEKELRFFLQQVSSDAIARYINYCLNHSFDNSGFVLQDLVNELGRRLDYDVENGLYRGKKNSIGHDGLWQSPEKHRIVVEVKTSDTYRISLDTIANYKKRLSEKLGNEDSISILIVVGNQNTGDLEAQVRGSKHAWDMRIISAKSLTKLVQIKESTEEKDTLIKIRSLLVPVEYTRVDQLIDVLFTAARDVEASIETEQGLQESDNGEKTKRKVDLTDSSILKAKREAILAAVEDRDDVRLVRKTRATYWNSDRSVRVVCTISKRYTKSGHMPYWYAYHPNWDEFLDGGERAYFVLGCVDLDIAFAIPQEVLKPILADLNTTEREDGKRYWHIKVVEEKSGEYALWIPKQAGNLSLQDYIVQVADLQSAHE
ncbi:MAG TPA: hypothetical protein VKP65_08475 [Rhodothermales bacterium]|nr:hypothetical protein [Rhodothermales bacterium]